jgi:hypothetical protein
MSDITMQKDSPLMVNCGAHGKRIAAVVCGHLLRAQDRVVGFVENSSDPSDLQAWCDACEDRFLSEQALTPAFETFNDRAIVCVVCYQNLKAKHSRRPQDE